jgi:hypothetical protein
MEDKKNENKNESAIKVLLQITGGVIIIIGVLILVVGGCFFLIFNH